MVGKLTDAQLMIELIENVDEFEDHQAIFIKSVNEFFKRTGRISEAQREHCEYYYGELIRLLGIDS